MSQELIELILSISRWVPVILPSLWIFGGIYFYFRNERKDVVLPEFAKTTPVSILVPCFNEERTVRATVRSLDRLQVPDLEVILINDGSRDRTLQVLQELAATRPYLRILNLTENRGKAAALTLGTMISRHELILCLDADSELDLEAIPWMVRHFESSKVAAVTGNPRVKNRGTLVGRLQVGEFSALVGMIKRYHQSLGRLFALSGVLVMFRKSAVAEVGYWDTETVTEDIGISWKLQMAGWRLRYEPRAICDVLMPDTLKGLWRQRLRWAQGGSEVMGKHAVKAMLGRDMALKLIVVEYLFSVTWVFALPLLGILLLGLGIAPQVSWATVIFWSGIVSLFQFCVGTALHARYEPRWSSMIGSAIWYPFLYWMLNSCVLFVAVPKVLFGKKKKFSTWISPDRGGVTYAQDP